jgi:hypothetical protein
MITILVNEKTFKLQTIKGRQSDKFIKAVSGRENRTRQHSEIRQ